MLNEDRLPPEVVPVLAQHVDALLRVFGEKLVGVYVHGSAAMGGFNTKTSDLDYLALTVEALSPQSLPRALSREGRRDPLKGRGRQSLSQRGAAIPRGGVLGALDLP